MLIRRRLYRDQLALSERHLDNLLSDTTSALDLLAGLSQSFKTVESETTAFQAQCEDLLAEQKRIRDLADEVGTDLQYYAYLEPLTRRLNAPGAGRLVRSDDFLDMLLNLNTCIDFMDQHVSFSPIPPPNSLGFVTKSTRLSKCTSCYVHVSHS
jgi:conserved oligomeric Golgi complex subunit 3